MVRINGDLKAKYDQLIAAGKPAKAPINHVVDGPDIPVFVVIAEYDNPDLDTQGALLYAEICQARGACPRFEWMEHHNHLSMVYQFNTEDREMGEQILDFIDREK